MNSNTKIQNEDFFPELNIQNLKVLYVEEWIREYHDIPIDRVTLYHYRSDIHDYIRYRRGDNGRLSPKYAIVFDFSDKAELSECDFLILPGESRLSVIQRLPPDASIAELLKAAESIKTNPCIEFIKQKLEQLNQSSGRCFGLLNSGFGSNIYRNEPLHSFYDEWKFLPRWKGRVSLSEAAGHVKTDAPHCVLFERDTIVLQEQIPQNGNLDGKKPIADNNIFKEVGRLGSEKRWGAIRELYSSPIEEAIDIWEYDEEFVYHNEMCDYLWNKDKYPDLVEHSDTSKSTLLKLLRKVAYRYERVRGVHKKIK